MRPLIAIALLTTACSSKPERKTVCVAADAPTIRALFERCGTIFIEGEHCQPRAVERKGDRQIRLVYDSGPVRRRQDFWLRPNSLEIGGTDMYAVDANGVEIIDPNVPQHSCVPSWGVTTLEPGVFSVSSTSGLVDDPNRTSYWHVERARCETSRTARMRERVVGMHGCM